MRLAIMQPYFFPYLNYYQMVNAVDKFMFYDDVNFIKRGWINRTFIISNHGKQRLTVSLKKISQNRLINQTELVHDNHNKILKTISNTYKKAPYFKEAFPILEACVRSPFKLISEYAANSIVSVFDYLGIKKEFGFSSEFHRSTMGYEKARRLIDICRKENATTYINSIGGMNIYSKEQFQLAGIELYFMQSSIIEYSQHPVRKKGFEPNLSMIDVLMFNHPDKISEWLNDYELL